MGACLSCLGLNRHSSTEADERTRLLQDGATNPEYQSLEHDLGGGNDFRERYFPQPSAAQLRRERDALERACTTTSDKLVDVSPNSTLQTRRNLDSQHHTQATSPLPQQDGDDEHTWVREVLEQDPLHKLWDPALVPSVHGGRVALNFEDMLGGQDRPSAKQALKDALS